MTTLPTIILTNQNSYLETIFTVLLGILKDPKIWAFTMGQSFFSGLGTGIALLLYGGKITNLLKKILKIEEKKK